MPTYPSIEDCLGPAKSRFFGGGYRNVSYHIHHATTAPDHIISGRVQVSYPTVWSTKSGPDPLPPHLSTLDALLLGIRFAQLALTQLPGLTEEARAAAWPSQVSIKAGATPDTDDLHHVPVSAQLTGTTVADTDATTTVDARVGSMKLRLELTHPTPIGRQCIDRRGIDRLLLGSTHDGPYGDLIHHQHQHLRRVRLEQGRATAAVTVEPAGPPITLDPAPPRVSMVDAFVISLQLGQALLYGLDNLDRARSNNLWMRTARIHSLRPPTTTTGSTATAALTKTRLLPKDGGTWRAATITADCYHTTVECAVAHQLPDSARPAA